MRSGSASGSGGRLHWCVRAAVHERAQSRPAVVPAIPPGGRPRPRRDRELESASRARPPAVAGMPAALFLAALLPAHAGHRADAGASTPGDCGRRAGLGISWGVQPPTVKLPLHAAPRSPPGAGSSTIDLAAQRGECEAAQLWVRTAAGPLTNISVATAPLAAVGGSGGGAFPAQHWQWYQQIYVNCSAHDTKQMYQPSAPGWYADPLLPTAAVPVVPAGLTQPLWVEVCVPRNASAGTYRGTFQLQLHAGSGGAGTTSVPVPVQLEVWPLTTPAVSDPAAFTTLFSFGQAPLAQWTAGAYRGLGTPWISVSPAMRDWFSLLAAHRTPADSIYYPNANYQVQGSSTWCAATRCRRSQAQYRLLDALGVQRFNIVDLACGMENMSDPHTLPAMLDAVNVSIAEAGGPDWLRGRGYVYGFDELAVDKLPVLIQIYGAVKARFGDSVKTVATLPDYPKPGMPVQNMQSLPVDVWVDAFLGHSRGAPYDAAKRATVAAFKASGKECEARGAAPASFCLSVCARTRVTRFRCRAPVRRRSIFKDGRVRITPFLQS